MQHKFYTDGLEFTEVEVKGQQKAYVSGYISTDELDVKNEVVPLETLKSMVEQINNGGVKLDLEHETFLGKADIPLGKFVEASIVEEGGKFKVFAKCEMNNSHRRFPEVWASIKSGFLDAFSIAYKPVDVVTRVVGGVTARVLKNIQLLNVALTGNPVNKGCTMKEAFLKSLADIEEENKPMAEEQITQEAAPVEPQSNDAIVAELKSTVAAIAELKSTIASQEDALKAAQATIAELKAIVEAPQLKAHAPVDDITTKERVVHPLDRLQ